MKKIDKEINLFDVSRTEHRSDRADKIKTTDINILLNRVRITKKFELKKKLIFLSLLILTIICVGIFSLI